MLTEAKPAPPPYKIPKSSDAVLTGEHVEVSFFSYAHVLWKRRLILAGCLIASALFAVIINANKKPVYQSTAEIVFQAKESEQSSASQAANVSVLQDPTFLLTQIRLVSSPILAERVIRKAESSGAREELLQCFSVEPTFAERTGEKLSHTERTSLTAAMRGSLSAWQLERGVRVIAISVTGYHRLAVKRLADLAAEAYIEMNYESQLQSFKKSFVFISKSLAEIREKIKIEEIALLKITREQELLTALQVYAEKHPSVTSLVSEIESLAAKLRQNTGELERMELGEGKIRFPILTEPHLNSESLTAVETDLQNLKLILEQEVQTNREMYNSIFKKLQEVELSSGTKSWLEAKILEPATVPGAPVSPNKRMNFLLALVVGAFIGISLIFFLEYLDSSIRSLDDFRAYLKIFPLGMVPHVDHDDDKEAQLLTGSSRSYWNTNDATLPLHVAEAYRIIRTNLAFGVRDSATKILQVTSAVKGEGKTTTVCNLGISMAQNGMKTLLVDADMRRPSLHHILGLGDNAKGLSSILSQTNGSEDWLGLIRSTPISNLFCLPSGEIPPNPAELLSSSRMHTFLNELKEHFDIVLIDSPPVISVADAPIIASFVEGTLFVTRAGLIPRNLCQRAKHALETVNSRVIGGILNSVTSQQQSYYYGNYYGYGYQSYSYYGDDTPSKKKRGKKKHKAVGVDKAAIWKDLFFSTLASLGARLSSLLKTAKGADDKINFDERG